MKFGSKKVLSHRGRASGNGEVAKRP